MKLVKNIEKRRYEMVVGDHTAFVDYLKAKNGIYLTHTEVPKEIEGQGVGSQLVSEVLKALKEDNEKVVPLCPFVAHYIREHPEWKPMIAEGYAV